MKIKNNLEDKKMYIFLSESEYESEEYKNENKTETSSTIRYIRQYEKNKGLTLNYFSFIILE